MSERGRLSADLTRFKREVGATDNHAAAFPAKVALRREALAWVGGAAQAAVLDCFAGEGRMHGAAWAEAARYLGNDQEVAKVLRHPGRCHCADAGFLLRFLDLAAFNVIDLDAYGSPWEMVEIVARRRKLAPRERLALVLTDGAPRGAMLGSMANALMGLLGMPEREWRIHGAHRAWPTIATQALTEAARRMGGSLEVLRSPAASVGNRGMFYAMAGLVGAAAPGPA